MKNFKINDDNLFDFFNSILLFIFALIFLYPLVFVFSASVSNPYSLEIGEIIFLPKGINLNSLKAAIQLKGIWLAYANTIFITVLGTLVSMFFTITGAYVLSKPELKYKKIFTIFVIITMWFDPGIIPKYLNFRNLGLLNSYSSVILGFAVNTFNVIILKSFFEAVPRSLEESAKIDGAGQWTILTKIYLPLSGSALTTVSLFYAISRWNGYFWTMILLTDEKKIPLQVYLKKLIVEKNIVSEGSRIITPETLTSPQSIIYSVIVLSIVPIIITYPFIQKFFKKGVTLGAVKE
ncbi:MAG: carbohydrate ABC transporter permease [Fusobacteriaceae bacterium]